MNSKGSSVIFTSIMIILLSVVAMVIIIGFVAPYITSLREQIHYKQNKENIFLLQKELLELKNYDINTIKNLKINAVDDIVFDKTTNTIEIKQKVSSNSFNDFRDVNYGNITIVKEMGFLVFTLDLDGTIELDNSFTLTNRTQIQLTILNIINGIPIIRITPVLGQVYILFIPRSSIFSGSQEIIINPNPTDANIYYTTDGTEPDENSTLYSAPITITTSTTIKAKAYATGYIPSIVITGTYTKLTELLDFSLFSISPESDGVFVSQRLITATADPSDANIYYTTDGNDPTEESTHYTAPITITETVTLKFKAFKEGYNPTAIITRILTKLAETLFYNQYNTNETTDLSGSNNVVTSSNVTFDSNGVNFTGDYNSYVLIQNDNNGSNTSLNLGNNNFTIDTFVSGDYNGSIFSKTGTIGGYDLFIDENRKVNFIAAGYDEPIGMSQIAIDENYIYIADNANHRIQKRNLSDWSLVAVSGGPFSGTTRDMYNAPVGIAVDDTYIYITEYGNHRVQKRNKSDLSYVNMVGGSAGTGNDNFYQPTGITVDDTYIYIAEAQNRRIQKRNKSDLTYVSKIGSLGSGDDQFSNPQGITVDGNYLYVSDSGNHRIVKRNKSDLTYVSKIGSSGSGNDQFSQPRQLMVYGNYLYVADTYNYRIQIRNISDLSYYNKITGVGGNFIEQQGIAVNGTYIFSSANYLLKRIRVSDYITESTYGKIDYLTTGIPQVAIDENYMYIADAGNNRIIKRRISDLGFVAISGDSIGNTGDDQYNNPQGIAVDSNYVYVADTGNNRIMKRNKSDLSYVAKIGSSGTGDDQFSGPYGITSDNTYVYVADTGNNRIVKRNVSDLSYISKIGTAGSGNDQFSGPQGIFVDATDNNLYIGDTGNNRIMKRKATDLSYITKIGTAGTGNDNFYTPKNLAVYGSYLYVADYGNNRIHIRNISNLAYVSQIAITIPQIAYTYVVSGIAVNDTNIFISGPTMISKIRKSDNSIESTYFTTYATPEAVSPSTSIIQPMTTDGEYLYYIERFRVIKRRISDMRAVATLGSSYYPGSTNYSFNYPWGIAVDDTYLYVAEYSGSLIKKFNKSTFVWVSTYAPGTTIFQTPYGIHVDGNYIYATLTSSGAPGNSIKKIDKNTWTIVASAGGAAGTDNNSFTNPRWITTDENYVYVADYGNYRLKKLNKSDLSFVSKIGILNSNNSYPTTFGGVSGIVYYNNYIYVCNSYSDSYGWGYFNMRKFDTNFNYVSTIGSGAKSYYQYDFSFPSAMAVYGDYMYIKDEARIKRRDLSDFDYNISIAGPRYDTMDYNYLVRPYAIDYDADYYYIANNAINKIEKRRRTDYSLVAYFGENAGLAGVQFVKIPGDIEVYGDYVYVADTGNHRIVILNKSDLSYYNYFGSNGTTDNKYVSPTKIAVDENYIYIADLGNHRIQKINRTTLAFVSKVGSSGVGNDQFSNPLGITVDDNYIYITEIGNDRIQKRNKSDLTYVSKIGSNGSGNDQFNNPYDITVDDNFVYIVEYDGQRIQKRNKSDDLNYVTKVGTYGVGNTNFNYPAGIRYKDENTLIVVDTYNGRIKTHNPSDLSYVSEVNKNPAMHPDGLFNPKGIAVDDNYIYIADTSDMRIVKKNKDTLAYVADVNGFPYGTGNDQFYNPGAIAVYGDYIYVADTSSNRIMKRNKSDLTYVTKIGSTGVGNDQFSGPEGITSDGNYVYVADTTNNRIVKRNASDLSYVTKIGTQGTGNDQFNNPRQLAVYGDYLYVADTVNNRIMIRNKSDLSYVSKIGAGGGAGIVGTYGPEAFSAPAGIAIYNDRIYVADTGNNRIKVFDLNFNLLYQFGSIGWEDDQLNSPWNIAVDGTYIYIAEYLNHRIVKRALSDVERIEAVPKTNTAGIKAAFAVTLQSTGTITSDSQIVLKRTGNLFCIYINGVQDNCEDFTNMPLYLTYPEIIYEYTASATPPYPNVRVNYNNLLPYEIGGAGLAVGDGIIRYLRVFDTNLSDSDINSLYYSYE